MRNVVVLICGASDVVNELTASRVYHTMLNHGVSCETVNLYNNFDACERFGKLYRRRQRRGELPRVTLLTNHPAMDKSAKMGVNRSYWGDITLRPTLSVCLTLDKKTFIDGYAAGLDDKAKAYVTDVLMPAYEQMRRVNFGSRHHRTHSVIGEHAPLLAAGKIVDSIHWILGGCKGE